MCVTLTCIAPSLPSAHFFLVSSLIVSVWLYVHHFCFTCIRALINNIMFCILLMATFTPCIQLKLHTASVMIILCFHLCCKLLRTWQLACSCIWLLDAAICSLSACSSDGRFALGRAYNGEILDIPLPDGMDACDIGTFTIWCQPASIYFNSVTLPRTVFVSVCILISTCMSLCYFPWKGCTLQGIPWLSCLSFVCSFYFFS